MKNKKIILASIILFSCSFVSVLAHSFFATDQNKVNPTRDTQDLSRNEKTSSNQVISTFSRNLKRGDSGEDVKIIQEFLSQDSTIYPEALITGHFGDLTGEALARFQLRYGLPQTGVFDTNTRNTINLLALNAQDKLPSRHDIVQVDGSIYHMEPTDIHWENTDVHLSDTVYHSEPTNSHTEQSITHYEDSDIHIADSGSHSLESDSHQGNTKWHFSTTESGQN